MFNSFLLIPPSLPTANATLFTCDFVESKLANEEIAEDAVLESNSLRTNASELL